MKIVQVLSGIVHWHTPYKTMGEVPTFPPDITIVEAPDYVFPGWGYINGEFIKPTAPQGWLYDDATGTFYPLEGTIPAMPKTPDQIIAEQDLIILDLTYENILLKEGLQ